MPIQDIAALTLANGLRDLRSAQRSAACSPRLSGVAAHHSHRAATGPLGGVERPRRVVRFARLMHRRDRAFGPAFGRRRLRRQSQPDLITTYGGGVMRHA
jgi:hypothetical protein